MQFNIAQWKVLNELNIIDPTIGLTSNEVLQRRRGRGSSTSSTGSNSFEFDNEYTDTNDDNTVVPPINCPNWICCLLPCINYIESMKIYKSIVPEDTIVLRNNNWIQYDASSLVIGDTIQLHTNTIVPADCIILYIQNTNQNMQNHNQQQTAELIVDMKYITGYDRPISINVTNNNNNNDSNDNNNSENNNSNNKVQRLFWGSTMVDITNNVSIIAIVTAIGKDTYVSKLIQKKQFPPTISIVSNLSSSIELIENGTISTSSSSSSTRRYQDYTTTTTNDDDDDDAATTMTTTTRSDGIALLNTVV